MPDGLEWVNTEIGMSENVMCLLYDPTERTELRIDTAPRPPLACAADARVDTGHGCDLCVRSVADTPKTLKEEGACLGVLLRTRCGGEE